MLRYGHPEKSEVGEIAAVTPWVVIHHSKTYQDRERNFKYLFEAYNKGDKGEEAFIMYLGRMYEIRNHERFIMDAPFTNKSEIDQLIKELELK